MRCLPLDGLLSNEKQGLCQIETAAFMVLNVDNQTINADNETLRTKRQFALARTGEKVASFMR